MKEKFLTWMEKSWLAGILIILAWFLVSYYFNSGSGGATCTTMAGDC